MTEWINKEQGLDRFGDNKELYIKFLSMLKKEKDVIEKVTINLKEKDYENLLLNVHTIKGVSGNLSLTKLYEISCKIVSNIRTESYETLNEDIIYFIDCFNEALINIENLIQNN